MTNDLISNTAEGNDSIPKKGTTNKYINSSGEVVIPSNPNNPSFSKGGSETSVVLDDKGNYVNQSPTIVPPANKTFDDIKSNNVGNEPGFWKQLENEGKQSIAYVTGDLYKLVNRLIYPIVEDIARPRTFTDKEARENPLTKDAVLSDDDRRKMGYSEKDIKDFKKQDEAIHKTQMDFDKNAREGNNIVKAFFPDTKNRFINDVDLMATYLSGHDSKIGGIKSNIEQDLPVPNQWIAKPAGIFKGVAGMAAQGIVIAAALKTSGALAARLLYGIEFPEAASLAESLGNSSLGVPFAMSYGMSGYSADETFDKVRESKIKYYTNRGYDNKRAIFLAEQDATKAANLNMRIETLGNGLLFAVPIGALLQKTKAFGLPEDLIKSLEGKGEVKGLQELEETYSKLNRELLENNGEGWLKKTSKILGRAGQDAWMFGAMHPVTIGSEIAGEHIYGTRKYGDYTTKDNTFDILKLYQEEKDNVLSGFGMGVVMSLFGHVPFLYKESIFDEVKNDKGETIGYTPKAKVDNKGKVVTDYLGNTIFDTKRRIVSKEKLLKLERNRINTIAIEGAKQDVITLKDAYNRYIKNIVDIDNSGSEKDKKAHEEVERAKEDMQNAQMQFSIRNGLDKYLSDGLEAYTKQHKEDKELQQILSDKIKDIKDKRDIWDKLVNDYNWTYEERMTNVLDVLYNIKLNRFSAEKRLTEIKDNINKLDNKINDTTSTIDTESYKSLIDLQDKLIAAQILVKNYDEEFTGYIYDGRILADKDKIAKAESKAQVDYTNAMNGIISRVGEKYTEQYLTKVDDNDKEIKSLSGKDDDVSKSRIKELKEINERLNKEYDEKVDKEVNSILKAAETHYSLDNRREKQYLLNKQLFNESLVDSYNTAFNKITSNKGRIDFMKDFYKSIKILERQERTAKRDDFKRMINSINDLPTLLEVKDKYDKLDDKEFSKLIENRIDEIRTNIKNNLLKSTDVQTVSTVQTPDSEIIIQPEQTGEATEAERIATEKQDNKQANLVAPIVLNKSDKARDIQSSLNVEGHNTGSQYNTNNSGSQKLSKNASSIYKALNELHNKNTNFSLNWDYLTDRIKNVADEETAKLFKAVKNIGDLKELLKDNKARNLFIDRLSIQIDNKNHPPYLARYSYYKFNDTDKGGTDIGEYALTDGLINKYIANLPIKEIIEDIKSLTKTYTNNNRALEGTKDIEDSKTKATILKILNKIFNDKFEDKDLLSNTADRLKVDVYSYNNMLEHLYKLLTFSLGTNGKTVDQLTKEDITTSLDGWLNTLDNDFKGTQAVIQDFIEQINNGNDTDPISKLTKKTRTTVTAMGNLITTDKPHPIKDIFPKYESNGRWVIKNVEDSKTGKSSKKIVFESDFNAKHQWVTINHKMPPINEAEYKIIWDNIDKALTKIKEGKKDIRKEVNAIEQLIWYSFPDNTTDRKKINFTINSNAKPNTGIHAEDIDVLEFEHYIDITKSEYVKVILDSKNKEYSIIVDDKPFAKATTNDELEKILKPLLENKQRNINKNRYEYSDKEGKYMPVSKETTKVKDENGKDTDETELNKEGNELIKSGRIQCYNGKLVSNDNEYLGNNVIRGTQPATITSSSDIEKEGDNIEKEKSLSLFPPKGESSKSQDLPTSEDKIANNKSIVNTELSNVIDKSIEADRYGLLTNYLDKLVNKDYNSKEEVTSNLDLLNDTLINLLKKKIPEGYREVAPNEIIPAGDYDTHMDLTSERTITNAPRTSKSKPIVKDKNEYIINNLNAAIAVLESELDEFKEVEPIVTPTRVETMPRANIITEPDKYQWKSFAHSDINDEDKLKGVVDNESVQKKIAQIRNGERPPIQLEVDESGKLIKNNNETYTTVIGHHTLAAYDKLIETGEYKEEIPYNTSTRRSGESDKVYAERVDRIKGTEYKGIGDDNILFQKVTPTLLDESLAIKYEEGFDNNNQLSFDNSNDAENKLKELNNKYKYQKFELGNDNVKYMFKAVNAMYKEGFPKYDISKNKGEAFFNALKNSGVKKEQIDLVREVVKGYNNLTGKEVAELLDKDFKKDIVIKRGLSDDKTIPQSISNFNIDGDRYYIQDLTFDEATNNIDEAALAYITRGRTDEEIDELYRVKYYKNGQEINKEDYENIYNSLPDNIVTSSKVYQYLSAKGGTNYQEWDIRVPGVEPSIKSHANFANKNSIGWFRADEKSNGFIKDDGNKIETGTHEYYSKNGKYYIREKGSDFIEKEVSSDVYNHAVEIARDYYKTETKDLRVQEVQSDLFQKSRGRDSLVYIKRPKGKNDSHWSYEVDILDYQHEVDIHDHPYIDESEEEYQTRLDNWEQGKPNNANRFLQLLNKDNNWVTFFIKSIMQKAANKGYENIMFPMGETAARIQGHQIIADEIIALDIILDKWKSAKIEKIDKGIDDDFPTSLQATYRVITKNGEILSEYNDIESAQKKIDYRIENLEKQKSDLKTQGIEKLAPTEAYYGKTIKNILTKLYGDRLTEFTDEYGNSWNKISLKNIDKESILFSKVNNSIEHKGLKEGVTVDYKGNPILPAYKDAPEAIKGILNMLGEKMGYKFNLLDVADKFKGRFGKEVDINTRYASYDTPFHEYLHPLVRALKTKNTPAYLNLINEINDTLINNSGLLSNILSDKDYSTDGKSLTDAGYEEAIVEVSGRKAVDILQDRNVKQSLKEAILAFWNEIKETIKSIVPNRVGLDYFGPKTTISDLAKFMLDPNIELDRNEYDSVKPFVGYSQVKQEDKFATGFNGIEEKAAIELINHTIDQLTQGDTKKDKDKRSKYSLKDRVTNQFRNWSQPNNVNVGNIYPRTDAQQAFHAKVVDAITAHDIKDESTTKNSIWTKAQIALNRDYKINIDDDEKETNKRETEGKGFQEDNHIININNSVNIRVKNFLRNLPLTNMKGEYEINDITGLPKFTNYSDIFNTLSDGANGILRSSTVQDMFYKLNKLSSSNPTVKEIIKRLNGDNKDLVAAFFTSFSQSLRDELGIHFTKIFSNDGSYKIIAKVQHSYKDISHQLVDSWYEQLGQKMNTLEEKVRKDLESGLTTKGKYDPIKKSNIGEGLLHNLEGGLTTKDTAGTTKYNEDITSDKLDKVINIVSKQYKEFGIRITPDEISNFMNTQEAPVEAFYKIFVVPLRFIAGYLGSKLDKEGKVGKDRTIGDRVNKLAEAVYPFRMVSYQASYLDFKGKLKYPISPPSSLTNEFDKFNNSNPEIQKAVRAKLILYKHIPGISFCNWFSKDIEKTIKDFTKLRIYPVEGMKFGIDSKDNSEMTNSDRYLYDLYSYLIPIDNSHISRTPLVTQGDSGQRYGLAAPIIYTSERDYLNGKLKQNSPLYNGIMNTVRQELARMLQAKHQMFEQQEDGKYKLKDDLTGLVKNYHYIEDKKTKNPTYIDKDDNAIGRVFKFHNIPELNNLSKDLFSQGMIVDGIDFLIDDSKRDRKNESQNKTVKEITDIVDKFIDNIINTELPKYAPFEKMSEGIWTDSKNPIAGGVWKQVITEFGVNSYINNVETGNLFLGTDAEYATSEDKAKRAKELLAPRSNFSGLHMGDGYKNITLHDIMGKSNIIDDLEKALRKQGISDRKINEALQTYRDGTTESDGQELVSNDFYIKYLLEKGVNLNGYIEKSKDGVYKFIHMDEYDAPQLGVQKSYTYDRIYNPDLNQIFSTQLKSAIYRLDDYYANEGSLLAEIRKAIEDARIDKVSYNSAVKVGAHGVGSVINSKFTGEITDIPTSATGSQVEIPDHSWKAKIRVSKQIKAMIINHLILTETYNHNGNNISGTELFTRFNNAQYNIIKGESDKLKGELNDPNELAKILNSSSSKFGTNINIQLLFKTNENGELPMGLNWPSITNKVAQDLMALFDNRITNYKINGGQFTIVSNAGRGGKSVKSYYDEKKGIVHEIAISAWGDECYKSDENGKLIFVNGEPVLKLANELTEEQQSMFGYRTPFSDLHSGGVFKVVEILPKSSGGICIIPPHAMTAMGSDNDSDKLYIHIHNTDAKPGSQEADENELVSIWKTIYSHPSTLYAQVKPVLYKESMDAASKVRDIVDPTGIESYSTLNEQHRFTDKHSSGKELISHIAGEIPTIDALSFIGGELSEGVTQKYSLKDLEDRRGLKLEDLEKRGIITKDDKNPDIVYINHKKVSTAELGQLLDAMTDISKLEDIPVNYNKFTDSIVHSSVLLNGDYDYAWNLIAQNSIRDITKVHTDNSLLTSSEVDKKFAVAYIRNKYAKLLYQTQKEIDPTSFDPTLFKDYDVVKIDENIANKNYTYNIFNKSNIKLIGKYYDKDSPEYYTVPEMNTILKNGTKIDELSPEQKVIYYAQQLNLINRYEELTKVGKDLLSASQKLNSYKAGAGDNVSFNRDYIDNILKTNGNIIINGKPFEYAVFPNLFGFNKESVYPNLEHYVKYVNQAAIDILAKHFTIESNQVHFLINKIYNDLNIFNQSAKDRLYRKFINMLINHLLEEHDWFKPNREETIKNLGVGKIEINKPSKNISFDTFKDLSFGEKIEAQKIRLDLNPLSKHVLNYLDTKLSPYDIDKNEFHYVDFKNTHNEIDLDNDLINSFQAMNHRGSVNMSIDEEFENELFDSAVKYAKDTFGFAYGNNSFAKLVPIEALINAEVGDVLNNANKDIHNGTISLPKELTDIFIRGNINNIPEARAMFHNNELDWGTPRWDSNPNTPMIFYNIDKFTKHIDNSIKNSMYIKVRNDKTKSYTIFKRYHTNRDIKYMIFYPVETKGKWNVQEITNEPTMFDSNKVGATEQQFKDQINESYFTIEDYSRDERFLDKYLEKKMLRSIASGKLNRTEENIENPPLEENKDNIKTEPKESPTIKLANRDIKVDDLKDFITHFDKDNDDELGDYYNSDIAQVIITAYDKNEDRWNKEHPNQKFPYNNEKEYVEDALKSYSDFEVFQNEIFKSELKLLDVPDINVKPSGEQFRFEQRANILPEDSADRFSKKMKYLNSIWAKHGVNVPFIEDRNISGHAEVEGKDGKYVIKYNPTDIRKDSAFHEYGHVLLHLLGGLDNEFIRTGVEQLRGTKLWDDISAIYADKDDDARQLEILNTAIGIDANELFEEKEKVGKFRFWVNRLFDRFADLLHKVTGGMFGKEQTVARELALDLLKGRLRSTRNGKLVDFFAEHKKNIDEIDDDSDKYKNAIERGTEEDGLYINTKTGKRYERVSKVLEEYQDKFDISLAKNEVGKPYAKELKLNTTEDVVKFWDYLRDGVGTGIHNKIHSYIKNGTKSDLPIQLTDWIDNLKKTGKLYSELRIVEDNHGKGSVDGMGGSLDLLHINKSGKHTIYDFKTKREGKFNWFNYEGDKSEFKGELNSFLKGIKQSTSNEYAVRLATYNYILNENLVNPVEAELKIIPITVDITRNDKGEFQYNNVQFGATVGLGDKEEFKTEIKLPNYVNNMHDFFLRGDNVKDAIKVKKDAIDRKAITTADVIKHTNSVKALSELHENIVKNTKRKSNLSNTLKEVTANTSELVFFLKHPESFDIASYEEVELMKSFGKTYEAIGKSIDDTLTNIGDMLENYRGFKLQNLSKAEYNDMFKTIYEAKTLANIYEAIDNIDDLPGEDTEALTDVQKEIVSLIKSINSKKEDIKILNRKVDLLENKTFADAFATNLTNPIFEGKDLDELVEFLNDFRHVDESSIQGWANSINNSNEPFLTYVGQRYRDMKLNTDTKIREVRTIIVNKFQDYLKSKGAFEKLLDKEHWKNFTKVISKDIFTRGDVRRHWKELTKFIDKDRMFIREHDYNKYNEAKEKEIGEIKDRFSKEYDKSYKEGDLSLSDMEDKEGWVSRMSKFEIAKWYEDNTKNVDYKIEKARTIYQSEHLTTEAFDKWKAENFIKGGKYYTVGGEFSTPSDRFKNPEFDKFDDKDKEMLKFMIDTVNEYSEGHQKKGLIPSYRTTRLKVKGKDGKDDDKIGRDINGDVAYNLNMEGLGFMNTVPRIYIPKYGEGINPKTKEYNIGESNEEYEIRALEEINNYGHSFKSLKEVELENRKIDKENKEHMSDGLENNLINILLDFTAGGIKYNAKADLEDELKLVGAMIRSKTFENSKKEDITGDASKANKHFENFMKMVFYEDFYSEAAKSKWVKYLQGLTTNLGLLFNYLGQAKYMILAPIRKFELTQSKEIGNRKDSYKAYWFYMKGLKSYFTDPINMSGKSTTIQQALIKKSGVMLTSIDKAVAYKTGIFAKLGKAIGWHMVNKAGFAVLHSTVHFNQVNVLFEMMYSHRIVEHKIIDKSGNKVTYKVEALIDYLEDRLPKEGTIIDPKEYKKLKEKYTKEFEQNPNLISSFELRNGEAELKKGVKLDDKALSAFFNKVRAINGTFHGIYNVEDKGAFEGTLGGMLSMIFHRWIKPGYDRRFGATGKAWDLNKKGYYDEALQTMNKGDRTAFFKGMMNVLTVPFSEESKNKFGGEERDVLGTINAIVKGYGDYVNHATLHWANTSLRDRASIIRSVTAFAGMAIIWSLSAELYRLMKDSKYKHNYALNTCLYLLNSLKDIEMAYVPIYGLLVDSNPMGASGFASVRTIKLIYTLGADALHCYRHDKKEYFQSGKHKHQRKFGVHLMNAIPISNNINRDISNYIDTYKLHPYFWEQDK